MRVPLIAWLIALLGLASGGAYAQAPTSVLARHSTRYVYCNVYLDGACFGIASGDILKMEIPVDFVLDTIHLWNGAKVVIYEGNHPEDVFGGKEAKSCIAASKPHQCQYTKSVGQYDLLYQATANSQMIQLRITGITLSNQAGVADFLSGFRQCHAVGQSEQCTDGHLFSDIN